MTWPKATVIGAVVVAATFLLCVEIPDLIVSKMTSVSRTVRADLATLWFTVALAALLFVLRRGQQRLLPK
jgi:hypothetical protein